MKQEGVCAICLQPETTVIRGKLRPLQIDTSHKTGAVRGLLCSSCNTGLGKFADSIGLLQNAAEYLRRRQYD